MSNVFNNSIWPNGLQDAPEGHPVFYPLGTNKVAIPDGVTTMWPDGDKLIGDFVYKNDKVVGFIDTKALIASSSGSTTMNYSYIDINLPSINEGELTVNAPNATVKKITWAVSTGGDNVIVTFKYKGCKTVEDVMAVDPDFFINDIVDGVWSEELWDLEQGGDGWWNGGMFYNTNLTSFTSDLPNLTNGTYMFYKTNLTSFSSNLSSLTNGNSMFYECENLESFTSDLPSLTNGKCMFYRCYHLKSFTSDLSNLTNGYDMFYYTNLESFTSDLSSLTDGYDMFAYCPLTSFSSALPSLTNGSGMFNNCNNLTSFSIDLSNLTHGSSMFGGCSNLKSFSSNLSNLTNGKWMFYRSGLESFSSDLSSLTDGIDMFDGCKLDAPSVKNIIDTINTGSEWIEIGMGCNNTKEDRNLFAQEVGYADMNSLITTLKAKGWNVYTQYNGRPTTTYGLRRPSTDTLPVFVQLEETEEHGNYTSVDGSKKYRLNWFHETTGSTEGYTQYASLEEAIETLNIKPIERN